MWFVVGHDLRRMIVCLTFLKEEEVLEGLNYARHFFKEP